VALRRRLGPADVTKSEPVKAKPDKPYFAHLAMCRSDDQGDATVQPPLGWVLSQATRDGLDALVLRCGNREQLEQLEAPSADSLSSRPSGPLHRTEELDGAERLSTVDAVRSAPTCEHSSGSDLGSDPDPDTGKLTALDSLPHLKDRITDGTAPGAREDETAVFRNA